MHSETKYDAVMAQVNERLSELKTRGIPQKLKELPLTVRNSEFLLPTLKEVAFKSEDEVSFTFNGTAYSIVFTEERPYSVPTGLRLCNGTLVVKRASEVVLQSSFEAKEDEWGFSFYYRDTVIYKRGDWVNELLRLKPEADALRQAREQGDLQTIARLATLRNNFGLSENSSTSTRAQAAPHSKQETPESAYRLARLLGSAFHSPGRNAGMLESSRKRLVLYLVLAILLTWPLISHDLGVGGSIARIIGSIGGALLILAMIGEPITWALNKAKKRSR